MQRHLTTLGIAAQKVVRKRESGDYVAEFFIPDMNTPVAPAQDWAQRIRTALPQAIIVDVHDTIANWRPGQPVIYATVIFRLREPISA